MAAKMRIAIIGGGNVGPSLANGWLRTGHEVAFGVAEIDAPNAADLAKRLPAAAVLANGEAVATAEVIVLSVPWAAVPFALDQCGDLRGKIVLDATNPLRLGEEGLELAVGFTDLGGESVARLAPGARIVKTMNQVGFAVMSSTGGYPAPPAMFMAGDDPAAKELVGRLVKDLGFEVFDAGPLRQSRLLEPYAMLWIDQVLNRKGPASNAFGFMEKAYESDCRVYSLRSVGQYARGSDSGLRRCSKASRRCPRMHRL
jgi:predicted dinucleotide-binding enzyme